MLWYMCTYVSYTTPTNPLRNDIYAKASNISKNGPPGMIYIVGFIIFFFFSQNLELVIPSLSLTYFLGSIALYKSNKTI